MHPGVLFVRFVFNTTRITFKKHNTLGYVFSFLHFRYFFIFKIILY